MAFKLLMRVCCCFSVLLAIGFSQSATAGMLVKADIDRMFDQQYLVGDIQPNMPLWPLFEKSPEFH